jgi:DNA adenine methylase
VTPALALAKWVGGKRQLLPVLLPVIQSQTFGAYHEPFVGGGAVFFALRATFDGPCYLSDVNEDLMDAYQAVRDDLSMLMMKLGEHAKKHSKEYYYELRAHPYGDATTRAARMLYLNRACFNGIYRVNSKGLFNVPWGDHESVTFDAEGLRACSRALTHTGLHTEDFRQSLTRVKSGDLVYLDSPYVPLSGTSNFVGYGRLGFGERDQEDLAEVFRTLASRGARCVLSNSDCSWVRELYEGFTIRSVSARRNVNSKGNKRGPVGEVVVTNF